MFARNGAKVVVADWHDGSGVASEIRAEDEEAVFVKTDVSKAEDVERMIEAATDTYGRLDVLFNNAGIEGETAPTVDCSLENWHRVIEINLSSVFYGMKFGIPAMLKTGGGSIINNASVAGLVGFAGIPAYCASKGGVVQLSKAAALEYAGQGIRVNAICPGVIWTPMVERFTSAAEGAREALEAREPVGRFGTADEIAAMATFLASDDSSFCTGAPFVVDGGFVAA
jgi:NAD(P)-dependent dehydrogenase (short-subunit alcohol dehydrogenase family)